MAATVEEVLERLRRWPNQRPSVVEIRLLIDAYEASRAELTEAEWRVAEAQRLATSTMRDAERLKTDNEELRALAAELTKSIAETSETVADARREVRDAITKHHALEAWQRLAIPVVMAAKNWTRNQFADTTRKALLDAVATYEASS